jgi:hypothetical protein
VYTHCPKCEAPWRASYPTDEDGRPVQTVACENDHRWIASTAEFPRDDSPRFNGLSPRF